MASKQVGKPRLVLSYSKFMHSLFFSSLRAFNHKKNVNFEPFTDSQISDSSSQNQQPVRSLLGNGLNFNAARLFQIKQKMAWKKRVKNTTDFESEPRLSNSSVALKYIMDDNDDLIKKYPDVLDRNYSGPDVAPEDLSHPYSRYDNLVSKSGEEEDSEDRLSKSTLMMKDYVKNYLKVYNVYNSDLYKYNSDGKQFSWMSSSSVIPCSGCGSILHCKDESIPGYMPQDKYFSLSEDELRNEVCRRCFFLKNYNTAIGVNIAPEDYEAVLSEIRYKRALVVLMVDMLDFPCSIWPGIINIIGKNRPIIVVGNKIDLLPCDQRSYLDAVKRSLQQSLKDFGIDHGNNIKHIALISAKTGFGIESLITKLKMSWKYKADLYLIGCTNVGKSSLFNVLLQSDLCKTQASDIVPPATTSVWPGTTLSLLKFPLFRMSRYEEMERTRRLINQQKEDSAKRTYYYDQYRQSRDKQHVTVFGTVEKTYEKEKSLASNANTEFSPGPIPSPRAFNPEDQEFKASKYFYDTPGSVYKEQILDLLTTNELLKVLPKDMIIPRTIQVRRGQTMFVSGLARIDFIQGQNEQILLTVFSSSHIPIHLVDTKEAELFYRQNIGTKILGVPFGNESRLANFPALEARDFAVITEDIKKSCADIVLSSIGWVSITGKNGDSLSLRAYSPRGRGLHLRNPAVLPFAVNLRGVKIKGVPTFKNSLPSIMR